MATARLRAVAEVWTLNELVNLGLASAAIHIDGVAAGMDFMAK